jgi:hypothetical protein
VSGTIKLLLSCHLTESFVMANGSCEFRFDGSDWVLFRSCEHVAKTCPGFPATAMNELLRTIRLDDSGFAFAVGGAIVVDCNPTPLGTLLWARRDGQIATQIIYNVSQPSSDNMTFSRNADVPQPQPKPSSEVWTRRVLQPDGTVS